MVGTVNDAGEGLVLWLVAFGTGIILFFIIWCILAYVLTAFGLYTMAKRQGREDAYFAFIPFLHLKTWGDLVETRLPASLQPNASWKLVWIAIGLIILQWIPFLNILSSIAIPVMFIWLLYLLLDRYGSDAPLFTILHFITGFIFVPLHIFLIRNKDPKEMPTVV